MEKNQIYIIHGWYCEQQENENRKKWQKVITNLEKNGFKVNFLDIPGLSAKKRLKQAWNIDDYTDWLQQKISGQNNILIGHSFGGQLSVKFAATFPDQVSKLVLIDPAGIRDHSLLADLKRHTFLILAKIGKKLLPFKFAKKIIYKLARVNDYYQAYPVLKDVMKNVINYELDQDFSQIQCSTLLIWGLEDQTTPIKLSQKFIKKIKNIQFKTIKNARHCPQYTHREETMKHINNFINKK